MLLRSMLFVPADSPRKLAKALGSRADALILDLEDAVAPPQKPAARAASSQCPRSIRPIPFRAASGCTKKARIRAASSDQPCAPGDSASTGASSGSSQVAWLWISTSVASVIAASTPSGVAAGPVISSSGPPLAGQVRGASAASPAQRVELRGGELAQRLQAERPGLKVLFMSGYTDDAVTRHGVLEPGSAYVQKPFTPDAIARRVREVLDR